MIDETTNGPGEPSTERVGFCQDCGKPLTRETVRPVGAGVFCEPCLEARIGVGQAASADPATAPPAGSIPPPPPPGTPYAQPFPPNYGNPVPPPHSPSPGLAGLLAIIPGVGAFYNGQYAKGIAIFGIFAVLSELDHMEVIGWVFGLAAFAWWIYQIVDAHHTARAKREGLPLPDPFGLNDIGERLGFGKNWGTSANTTSATGSAGTGPAAATPPPPPPPPPTSSGWTTVTPGPVPPVPPTPASDWVGYVPPTAFAGGAVPPAQPYAAPSQAYAENLTAHIRQAAATTPYPQSPYAETYTGTVGGPMPPVAPILPGRRFPVGAIVLIGVGVLLLLANLLPGLHLSVWGILSILFLALGAWSLARRLGFAGPTTYPVTWATPMRGPVVLLTLAVIFGLQALDIRTFAQTWPLLLLALGAVMLVERTMGSRADFYPSTYPGAPVPPAAPTPAAPRSDDSTDKGGQ